jgi:hypothetical protein
VTLRRGFEVTGGCAVIAGAALLVYTMQDALLRLARVAHPEHFDLGLALAFVGALLLYLGRER